MQTEWITFDCYGTLVDWENGIRAFFRSLPGVASNLVDTLTSEWEEIQFALINGPYRPYHEILSLSLREALSKRGQPLRRQDEERFSQSLTTWKPFPDTNPSLEKLVERGFRLGIVSNIDDNLIESTLKLFSVRFDAVVTAQQCQAYKPSMRPFQVALERIACPSLAVVHAAFGDKYDLAPAHLCGIRTAFVNRCGKRIHLRPDVEVSDLMELVGVLSPSGHGIQG